MNKLKRSQRLHLLLGVLVLVAAADVTLASGTYTSRPPQPRAEKKSTEGTQKGWGQENAAALKRPTGTLQKNPRQKNPASHPTSASPALERISRSSFCQESFCKIMPRFAPVAALPNPRRGRA
jgi:hypothetical protein